MANPILDLTPIAQDIRVRSGDVRAFRLIPSSPELWAALTNNGLGGSWLAQVRLKESSPDVAVVLSVIEEADSLGIVVPASTSEVWGQSSKKLWVGVWDVQGMILGSEPVTIAAGSFIIERDVSR